MFPISEHDARRAYAKSTGKYQEKKPTRILLLGDGRGGAASNITAPGGRNYVWAREGGSANARYFPVLNLGAVQPAADLRVMVGYDPLSQYPNEEQVLGSYTTDTVGIGARVYSNTTTSTANNTNRLLSFNSEQFDSGSMHSTTAKNSRLVANSPGIYMVALNIAFSVCSIGDRVAQIIKNGDEVAANGSPIAFHRIPAAAGRTVVAVSTLYSFSTGDYVEAFAFQTSTGNLNVEQVDEYSPYFSMVRIEQNLV